MNETLLKALVLLPPVGLAFAYSVVLTRRRVPWSAVQLIGATCLLIVVLAHICEGLGVFAWMQWGAQHSAGHYLNLSSVVLGVTFLPGGYVLRRLIDSSR